MANEQVTFTIEHIRSGKLQQSTEKQFERLQKLFPKTFRKTDAKVDVSKYSSAAKEIIKDAAGSDAAKEEE